MTDDDRDDGCRRYADIPMRQPKLQLIAWVRSVVEEYGRQRMNISVRQCYYQAVARGFMESSSSTYNQIQGALRDGRMAGLIPWTLVEDRGRTLRGLQTQTSPAAALRRTRANYRCDLWAGQEYRPEVWVEKVALESVIGDICNPLRVDYYATRGYDSISQQWEAGQRMATYVQRGQRPVVLYLGDHDPSGLDMTRKVEERLRLFTGVPVMVQRLALTMSQIERYSPPPFDVKWTDSRALAYADEHGETAWELDALDPSVLKQVVSDAVGMLRDQPRWDAALGQEVDDLRELDEMIQRASGESDDDDDEDA